MKNKYIVLFLRNVHDIPTVIGVKRTSLKVSKVSFRKKSFLLNVSKPAYQKKHKIYYLVDFEIGQLGILSNQLDEILSPEILDRIISKEVVKQMLDSIKPMNILNILLYVGLGVFAGVGLGITLAGYME